MEAMLVPAAAHSSARQYQSVGIDYARGYGADGPNLLGGI